MCRTRTSQSTWCPSPAPPRSLPLPFSSSGSCWRRSTAGRAPGTASSSPPTARRAPSVHWPTRRDMPPSPSPGTLAGGIPSSPRRGCSPWQWQGWRFRASWMGRQPPWPASAGPARTIPPGSTPPPGTPCMTRGRPSKSSPGMNPTSAPLASGGSSFSGRARARTGRASSPPAWSSPPTCTPWGSTSKRASGTCLKPWSASPSPSPPACWTPPLRTPQAWGTFGGGTFGSSTSRPGRAPCWPTSPGACPTSCSPFPSAPPTGPASWSTSLSMPAACPAISPG